MNEQTAIRKYKCCDPDCKGFVKGHRHKNTCKTWENIPPGLVKGWLLDWAGKAKYNLNFIGHTLNQEGEEILADEIFLLIKLLECNIRRLKAINVSKWEK